MCDKSLFWAAETTRKTIKENKNNSESKQCNLVLHLESGLLPSASRGTTQSQVGPTTESQQPLGLQTEKRRTAMCRLSADVELN